MKEFANFINLIYIWEVWELKKFALTLQVIKCFPIFYKLPVTLLLIRTLECEETEKRGFWTTLISFGV